MMIIINFKKNKGFSLLEVTVVIFIVIVGLIGVLALATQSIKVTNYNKNELIASKLAQEGIEMVRNTRDTNWKTPVDDWALGAGSGSGSDIIQDGTYTIDSSGVNGLVDDFSSMSGAKLFFDLNGIYQHDDNVLYTKTPFSRLITVTNWSSYTNYIEVNCEVQWQEKGKINRYVISTILYDWR